MFSTVLSAAINGMESRKVTVEADVADGLPTFTMVGYLASETREAAERVRSALRNSGLSIGVRHITVNLAPAALHKQGSSFDLAIAIALLTAAGTLKPESVRGILFIGELGLNGRLNPVRGILEIVSGALSCGCGTVIVPAANLAEGSMIRGVRVLGAETLVQVVSFLAAKAGPPEVPGMNLSMQGALKPGSLYERRVHAGQGWSDHREPARYIRFQNKEIYICRRCEHVHGFDFCQDQ